MKNIVVVGGSHGIGAQLIKLLSDNGNNQITNVSRSAPQTLPNVAHVEADIVNGFPNLEIEQCDGLVYCPGSINLKPFHRLTQEEFLQDYKINFLGAVSAIQSLIKPLKRSRNASVVLFSTVAVGQGMPFHSSIGSAKAAVEGLTRSLAAEYAQNNLRFNCIAPSVTDTPLASNLLSDDKRREASARRHPLNRFGQPSDLASMAEFLLSEKAEWITGQVLNIDGGLSTLKII
jgi:NAD(P)-dependent dehydrogenase (short-subunit alcohol dehydrogenase family)